MAKYLQTILDKEAENGKSGVVADKLLAGKTRKEASRMFFETLVWFIILTLNKKCFDVSLEKTN